MTPYCIIGLKVRYPQHPEQQSFILYDWELCRVLDPTFVIAKWGITCYAMGNTMGKFRERRINVNALSYITIKFRLHTIGHNKVETFRQPEAVRNRIKKELLDTETNIKKHNTGLFWGCGTLK